MVSVFIATTSLYLYPALSILSCLHPFYLASAHLIMSTFLLLLLSCLHLVYFAPTLLSCLHHVYSASSHSILPTPCLPCFHQSYPVYNPLLYYMQLVLHDFIVILSYIINFKNQIFLETISEGLHQPILTSAVQTQVGILSVALPRAHQISLQYTYVDLSRLCFIRPHGLATYQSQVEISWLIQIDKHYLALYTNI